MMDMAFPGRRTLNRLLKNDYFWLIIILWLAFLLRTYALSDVAINNDESYDYNRWISVSLRAIAVDDLVLNNQSFAHILARITILLLGDSLFTLRWPAVCISILGVVAIYKIAGCLFGSKVGLESAFLLAVSPYAVFFAHTFRGYSAVIAFPLLIYLLAWLALQTNQWRYWIALGFFIALMMYTHLFTSLAVFNLLLFMGLVYFYGHRFPGFKKPSLTGLGLSLALAGILLAIFYSPVWTKLIGAFLTSGQPSLADLLWVQRPQVPATIWTDLLWFNGLEKGSFGPEGSYLFLGLVAIGLGVGFVKERPPKIWAVLGWAVLPFIEIWLLAQILADFWARPQYLGYTLPPLLILVSLAIAQLPRYRLAKKWLPTALTLFLVLGTGFFWSLTLREFYRNYTNGNWQAIGNFLQQNSTPQDLVVCQRYDQPWRDVDIDDEDDCTRTLNYRHKAGIELAANVASSHTLVYKTLPEANLGVVNRLGRVWLIVWNVPATVELAETDGLTVKEVNGFGRSFLFLADQQKTYVGNLAQALTAVQATIRQPVDRYIYNLMIAVLTAASGQAKSAQVALQAADTTQPDHPDSATKLEKTRQLVQALSERSIEHPLQADFGNRIMLQGYNLSSTTITPGSALKLTLFWQVINNIREDYTIFLHLRNQADQTITQFDYQPYGGSYPTQNWQPGQLLTDPHEFQVPPDFPPGEYHLVIGFYDRNTLTRLPLINDSSGENALFLSPLIIQQP